MKAYGFDHKLERNSVRSRNVPGKVEGIDDLIVVLSLQLLSRNLLCKQVNGIGNIPNHLRSSELLLCPSVLRHFKHPDPTSTRRCHLYLFRQVLGQVVDHAGLRQQEWVWRLLLVLDTGPGNLETPLGLELDDAHIKPLVEDDSCGWGDIGGGNDLGDALVQRAFEDGLGCAVGGMSGSEPQLYRLVLEVLSDLGGHLVKWVRSHHTAQNLWRGGNPQRRSSASYSVPG